MPTMKRLLLAAAAMLVAVPLATAEENRREELWGAPKVEVGVNLHALWSAELPAWSEAETEEPGPDNEFAMEMARFEVVFSQGKLIDAKLQGDFEELFGKGSAKAMMRDAWVRVRPLPQLGLKMGQLKRPFSRLQLRSKGKLETVWRGPSDAWFSKALGYGDRDLGVQLEGKFGGKERNVEYAVGVFSGSGKNAPDEGTGKDVVGRIEGKPVQWLSLGVNGAYKVFDRGQFDNGPESGWAVGADAEFKMKGFFVMVEGLVGMNHDACLYSESPEVCRYQARDDLPLTWATMFMAAYKFPIYRSWRLALQPMVKGEVLAPDADAEDGLVLTGTVGLNLWIGKHFRLMLHDELIEPGDGVSAHMWLPEHRFMTQVAFDL
jgi:hypothetical protein